MILRLKDWVTVVVCVCAAPSKSTEQFNSVRDEVLMRHDIYNITVKILNGLIDSSIHKDQRTPLMSD